MKREEKNKLTKKKVSYYIKYTLICIVLISSMMISGGCESSPTKQNNGYIEGDGDINITKKGRSSASFRILATENVLIDWGDGSPITRHRFNAKSEPRVFSHFFYDENIYYTIRIVGNIIHLDARNIYNIELINVSYLEYLMLRRNNKSTYICLKNAESLIYLNVAGNHLKSLDVTNNALLEYLLFHGNEIQSIDLSNNISLKFLWASFNGLSEIDVSNNTALEVLGFGNNNIADLNVSNNKNLVFLNVEDNNLRSLDVSNNVLLDELILASNELTTIDLSKNIYLRTLNIGRNRISNLNLSNNIHLQTLSGHLNEMEYIDLSKNINLMDLFLSSNRINRIDVSNSKILDRIVIDNNQLPYIDLRNNLKLRNLFLGNNNLEKVYLSADTVDLRFIDVHNNHLSIESMNELFESLPDRTLAIQISLMDIRNNPGERGSDRSIAESKGWHLTRVNTELKNVTINK